jgi:hypothetical protein
LKSYQIPFLFLTNYFPFVLIVIWILLKKLDFKNYKSFILLFSLIILAGLISRSTLYLMDDAYQLYTNTLSLWHVLSVLSIILLLSRLNTTNVKYKWITVIFILSTLAFNCYSSLLSYSKDDVNDLKFSKKYVIEVNNECEKLKENVNGATFYDSVFFKNTAIQYPYEYYCMPPILSSKLYPPYNLTSMDRVQSINSYQLEKTVKKSVYNQYLSELTKGKSFKDSIDNQINFIKTNQIKYLICPRSMKTDFKKYLSIKTEIYDSISGQRFITFN